MINLDDFNHYHITNNNIISDINDTNDSDDDDDLAQDILHDAVTKESLNSMVNNAAIGEEDLH